MKPIPLSPGKVRSLTMLYCRRRKSAWAGHKEKVTPVLLPFRFGDGKQLVNLSFYSAPELEVIVAFDLSVPMDHPSDIRFGKNPPPSFPDALDAIYDLCKWHIALPKWRRGEIERYYKQELEANELDAWDVVINHGSTWCHA